MTYRLFSLILAGLLALPCADAGAEALEPGQHAAEAAKESFRAKRAEAAGRTLNVSPASVRLINTAETAAAADIASMIKDGADVNLKTRLNETPLLIAARKNSAGALKVLLDAGAKPAQTDKLGWTALMQAAMRTSCRFSETQAAMSTPRTAMAGPPSCWPWIIPARTSSGLS